MLPLYYYTSIIHFVSHPQVCWIPFSEGGKNRCYCSRWRISVTTGMNCQIMFILIMLILNVCLCFSINQFTVFNESVQIANHSGYVQVDWKKVETDVNKAKKQLKKKANTAAPEINTFIEEATAFVKRNVVVSSGFVGGFLLGVAS
uniref:FUN14 domain containing 1 n=1 Tax=Astyanax mexicanus TaxID=7994 RepID=A0A8B9L3X7_ASTMX